MKDISHCEMDELILRKEQKRYVISKKKNWYSIYENFIRINGFYCKKCETYTLETPRGELDLIVEFCHHCGPGEFGTVLSVLNPSQNLLNAFNKK